MFASWFDWEGSTSKKFHIFLNPDMFSMYLFWLIYDLKKSHYRIYNFKIIDDDEDLNERIITSFNKQNAIKVAKTSPLSKLNIFC